MDVKQIKAIACIASALRTEDVKVHDNVVILNDTETDKQNSLQVFINAEENTVRLLVSENIRQVIVAGITYFAQEGGFTVTVEQQTENSKHMRFKEFLEKLAQVAD